MSEGFKAGDLEIRESPGDGATGDERFEAQPFEDSMAAAIEEAFEDAWKTVHGSDLPKKGKWDRRILFVAVARGVLGYLQGYLEKHGEKGLSVSVTQKEGQQIVSSGTTEEAVSNHGHSHEHQVEVEQVPPGPDGGNRVVCSEDAEVEIHVRDLDGTDG